MAGPPLDELIAALDAYVDPHQIPDFAVTGMQVRSAAPETEINRVALGVSANLDFLRRAAAWGAQLALTHHGLFWESDDPENDPARRFDRMRAEFIRAHGLSLAAYHLPLDAHPEVGNNAEIARLLGLRVVAHDFGDLPETEIKVGLTARAEPAVPLSLLVSRAQEHFGSIALVSGGPEQVQTIGIISGGGTREIYEAIERGYDLHITGEGREWLPALCAEAGISALILGHYDSETVGIQALGRWLSRGFAVETRFFPQANPF